MGYLAPDVHVLIYGPWGLDDRLLLSLGPNDISGCVITTSLPGGYNTLDVTLVPGRVPKSVMRANRYGHVVALVDGRAAFIGRLFTWTEAGRYCTDFPVKGPMFSYLDEHAFSSTDNTTITTGALLRTVLAASDALVKPATGPLWIDSQTPQVPSKHSGRMPSEVFNEVLTQGDALAQPTDALVWDDMLVRLLPRTPPAKAHYAIAEDDEALSRTPDYEPARGALSVDYTLTTVDSTTGANVTQPKTTARKSDAYFLRENRGVFRSARLHAGELSDDAAVSYRNAQLKLLVRPALPTGIRLADFAGLRTPEGAMVPQYLTRSGEWVSVQGDDAPLPLISTRCDVLAGTLELACGDAPLDYHTTLRRLRETDNAARVRVNVATGTRVG